MCCCRCLRGNARQVANCPNAVRVIHRKFGRDPITPVLRQLHWWPVRERIKYKKLMTLIYKALNCAVSPVYVLCSGRRQQTNYDHLGVRWLCCLPGVVLGTDPSMLLLLKFGMTCGFKRDFKTYLFWELEYMCF